MYHQKIIERFFDTGSINIEIPEKSHFISIRGIPCIKEKYNMLFEKVKSVI